jgi:GT2 family glycosyltransferase
MGLKDAKTLSRAASSPLVSVIIVTFNARRHIACCLDALLAQTYPTLEIIVVDNGSSDGTADDVAAQFPDVRLVRSPRNLGYAGGNNLGVVHAHGEFLAFLNPDTEAAPGWLAGLVRVLDGDATRGLATSKILLFDRRDRINTCGNDVHYTGLAFCRGLEQPATAFKQAEDVAAVSGAAFLMRRDLFTQLGGFDERFFMYLEDTDLSWRAALAGYRCVFAPDSIVYHHYAVRISASKTFYLERNRYLLLLRNCRAATLLLLSPALLLVEAVTGGYAALRGPAHLAAKLRAWWWIPRHWPAIVSARRCVQRERRVGDGAVLRRFSHRLALEQVASGTLLVAARALVERPFWAWQRVLTAAVRS